MQQLLTNLPIFVIVLLFVGALVLLSKSADYLTNNAIKLSKILKIPEIVIGATIVSIGTTLPEFATSIAAIGSGSTDLALGNAFGSVITNCSLILGISTLYGSIPVSKKSRSTIWTILLGLFLLILAILPAIIQGRALVLPRYAGIVLLVILPIYLVSSFKRHAPPTKQDPETVSKIDWRAIIGLISKILFSAALVTVSSTILVGTVQHAATSFHISEAIISGTVVALGTSLPELSTSIAAAKKGFGGLAIGNLLGASVMNIFLVLSTTITFTPGQLIMPSLLLKLHLPLMLLIFGYLIVCVYNSKKYELTKKEGIGFLMIYSAYLLVSLLN